MSVYYVYSEVAVASEKRRVSEAQALASHAPSAVLLRAGLGVWDVQQHICCRGDQFLLMQAAEPACVCVFVSVCVCTCVRACVFLYSQDACRGNEFPTDCGIVQHTPTLSIIQCH